jgi:flagellar protein FliS
LPLVIYHAGDAYMAIAQTKAASFIQEHTEEISPHRIISLLMDGALERIDQSLEAFHQNNQADLGVLLQKLIAIINGLRNSLDMKAGEIASNLDALYEYMVERITHSDELASSLIEVRSLIDQIKSGWDHMDFTGLPAVDSAAEV